MGIIPCELVYFVLMTVALLSCICKQPERQGGENMATWKCTCGFTKEGRCKPQKCEKCGEKGLFVKAE
jgi:hypothetical protein